MEIPITVGAVMVIIGVAMMVIYSGVGRWYGAAMIAAGIVAPAVYMVKGEF